MTQKLIASNNSSILAPPQLSIYLLNDSKCVYIHILHFQQNESTHFSISYHRESKNLSQYCGPSNQFQSGWLPIFSGHSKVFIKSVNEWEVLNNRFGNNSRWYVFQASVNLNHCSTHCLCRTTGGRFQ